MAHYNLHVRFNDENPLDRVIVAHLSQLGKRGKTPWVKQVLYEAVTGPTHQEILEAIQEHQDRVVLLLENSTVMGEPGTGSAPEEPELAAQHLDDLINRLEQWSSP